MAASILRLRPVIRRKQWIKTSIRTCYIVLLPETSPDVGSNPLLDQRSQSDIPNYDHITPDHCFNAIGKLSLDFETNIWRHEERLKNAALPKTYETVLEPIEPFNMELDEVWSILKTFYYVRKSTLPGEVFFRLHQRAHDASRTKFRSLTLYNNCKELKIDRKKLSEAQERIVDKYLLEGHLGGIEFTGKYQTDYFEIANEIEQQKKNFKLKIIEANSRFSHKIFDTDVVKDFPIDLLREMAPDSANPLRGPWSITLHPHIYRRFMEYCPNRALRWNTWSAYNMRCSNLIDSTNSNSLHMEYIRIYRKKLAEKAGFENFLEMKMETKMAGTLENVQAMIASMLIRAFPAQEQEIKELQEYANQHLFNENLQMWDVSYWRRKQKRSLFNFESSDLQPYFPYPVVISKLFTFFGDIFGVMFEQEKSGSISTWHPDVSVYRLVDEGGVLLGHLYVDPYFRPEDKLYKEDKPGWMVAGRPRSDVLGKTPIANLIFNFPQPTESTPSLLSLEDLEILFEKFGHALQHLLTSVQYMEVAGRNFIEWDAVEMTSFFLSNWLFEPHTLQKISSHYESGDSLPADLVENVCHSQHHLAGFDLCRELYFSSLELNIYTSKDFWADIMRRLWPEFHVFPLDRQDAHPCTTSALFSSDWAGGYYSNIWAKMIAADAYSAFQEVGIDSTEEVRKVGRRFRNTYLALGGSCHASEVFRRFRGRDPSPDALLTNLGLQKLKAPKMKSSH